MGIKKRGLFLLVGGLFFLIIVSFFAYSVYSDASGCYTFPQASDDVYCKEGISESEARTDCTQHRDCNLNQYFLPGSDCQNIDACQEITCTVDGLPTKLGKCQQRGGEAILPGEEFLWNTLGCCKVSQSFCQYGLLKFQCQQEGEKRGVLEPIFVTENMNLETCNRDYCQFNLTSGKIFGMIKNENDQPLANADVIIAGARTVSNAQGEYSFSNLNPGNYFVQVSRENYLTNSAPVYLGSGETKEQNFVLRAGAGIAVVRGSIKNQQNAPLEGAAISWRSSASNGQVNSNAEGNYLTPSLPAGTYIFTASSLGYRAREERITLSSAAPTVTLNFVLEPAEIQGISGIVYLDENNNKQLDSEDDAVYGAKIYIDGVFKGRSQYPDGHYFVDANAGDHTLSVSYQAINLLYEFTQTITIIPDNVLNQPLLLTTYVGECTEPGTEKKVEIFKLNPVLGKKQIKLDWVKPCAEVISYAISRNGQAFSGASADQTSYLDFDEELKWGESYTYTISAVYPQKNTEENSQTLTLGDKECENRDHDTFCLSGSKKIRQTVYTCDENNKLIAADDCSVRESGTGSSYYCARTSARDATCKNAGECQFGANPFGLYYNRQSCYGTAALLLGSQLGAEEGAKNYCYYDYSQSIVDECKSCAAQEMQSCFDYNSKDACTINNCLGSKCKWLEGATNLEPLVNYELLLPETTSAVTPETGIGYCVEEKYAQDDRCFLCGPGADGMDVPIFENFFCTADVCSGLGRCFSNQKLSQCEKCGETPDAEANCYTYNTEKECAHVESDPFGKITFSPDRCGWKRCLWKGAPQGFGTGSCVKDGNADGEDDCASFADSGERNSCTVDIFPPKTSIIPAGPKIISTLLSNLTFLGEDNSRIGLLGYCLVDTNPSLSSSSSSSSSSSFSSSSGAQFCLKENFIQTNYQSNQKSAAVTIDLTNSPFLLGKEIDGKTSRLLFYSEDRYKNREALQEAFIYIDNVAPKFEIGDNYTTITDTTNLFIFLQDLNEPAECTFNLKPILPLGSPAEIQTKTVGKDIRKKEVSFENLKGVIYALNVTCRDNQGNVRSKGKSYTFDLEPSIEIIYPKLNSFIAETKVSFQIRTAVGAACALYNPVTNEKIADFITDEEGKVHHTEPIVGFYENIGSETELSLPYQEKVICREILQGNEKEDYFQFNVDFTPPETLIYLSEGTDKRGPFNSPSRIQWEEIFIGTANVRLECQAHGFECDKIYYCLTDVDNKSCEYVSNKNYQEYKSEFSISNSATLCVYSTDKANNSVYQANCGKIRIEGFGITLEKPELYYARNEQGQKEVWGVSNQPIFEWQFFTRVPSQECRFDFISNFNYEALPNYKIKTINEETKKYLFPNFPESVLTQYKEPSFKTTFTVCKNSAEVKSPEQKMNLEYDPTAPVILKASANPNPVYEGISTILTAVTDDKTLCKYDDNSEGQGSIEFEHLSYSFPETEQKILALNHQANFTISSVSDDGKKDYRLNLICKNGAGDFSNPTLLLFSVDYSQVGYIISSSLAPKGSLAVSSVQLKAETNKNAFCEYRLGTEYQRFTIGEGNKQHSQLLEGLSEQEYLIPLKCLMGDHLANEEINFFIDRTPPVISSVEEGNYTCGSPEIMATVNTPEAGISGYYLELYDLGEVRELISLTATSSTSASSINKTIQKNTTSPAVARTTTTTATTTTATTATTATLVFNASYPPQLPLKISTANLSLNHKYILKVKAGDAAGNWGQFKESNGIYVVDGNYSGIVAGKGYNCANDTSAPEARITIVNETCTTSLIRLDCLDQTGCKEVKFGQSRDELKCVINNTYNGQNLLFKKSGWLCYEMSDYKNQNSTGAREIIFKDKDGDGINDNCDQCPDTGAGKIVDIKGCADGEVSLNETAIDTDKDSLPDYWEKKYFSPECLLNYTLKDTNNNGFSDGAEDYDHDNRKNYEEYLANSNPCAAEAKVSVPSTSAESKELFNISKTTKSGKEEVKKEEKEEKKEELPPASNKLTLSLALILLIIGLLLFFGGGSYLIYYYKYKQDYYKYKPEGRGAVPNIRKADSLPAVKSAAPHGTGLLDTLKQKLQFKKAYEEKAKARKREAAFAGFSKNSSEIPHLGSFLKVKSPQPAHLQELAQKYVEHKEEIKPGLKAEEKNIFAKLENIAKQTQEKKVEKVVSKEQTKDIFSKLKELNAKRKK